MSAVNYLDLHGDHYRRRKIERNVPSYVLGKIENFNAAEWELVMCEVRTDKGKFVNSTWELNFDGRAYRITIGFNNTVMTVVRKKISGRGEFVKDGTLYDFVEQINSALMKNSSE